MRGKCKSISVEHSALDLLGFVISENKSDHLLSCYCASRTRLKFLDSVVIGTTLGGVSVAPILQIGNAGIKNL